MAIWSKLVCDYRTNACGPAKGPGRGERRLSPIHNTTERCLSGRRRCVAAGRRCVVPWADRSLWPRWSRGPYGLRGPHRPCWPHFEGKDASVRIVHDIDLLGDGGAQQAFVNASLVVAAVGLVGLVALAALGLGPATWRGWLWLAAGSLAAYAASLSVHELIHAAPVQDAWAGGDEGPLRVREGHALRGLPGRGASPRQVHCRAARSAGRGKPGVPRRRRRARRPGVSGGLGGVRPACLGLHGRPVLRAAVPAPPAGPAGGATPSEASRCWLAMAGSRQGPCRPIPPCRSAIPSRVP